MIWQEAYKIFENMFKNSDFDDYRFELDNILKYVFNMNKVDIITNKKSEISEREFNYFLEVIEKRKKHIPLQYIIGLWEFMDLEFEVGEGVLIPREDTSVLVNECIKYLSNKMNPRIVDLCSGSGCIAIAIEKYLNRSSEVYGIEISERAFKYMTRNIQRHKSNVKAMNADIFDVYTMFPDNFFDVITSNPPYIKHDDILFLQPEVKFEPEVALDGGPDGLDFYRKICKYWFPKLKSGGLFAFEVGYNQFDDVKNITHSYNFSFVCGAKDINDINRVLICIK